MALSVHNPNPSRIILALLLLAFFGLHASAQDNQPTLEAALAISDPAARIAALQKFLQAQPESAQAETARAEITQSYAVIGETQLAAKDIDTAIQSFKRAIAAFPQQVDDRFFTEVASRIPLAVSVRGYRTEAILLARELEARFAKEANRLTALGEFYLSVEAPSEALRALTAAAKLAPEDARIYRTLGAAYRVNLDLDEAAAQYQHAIQADPQDKRAYFELANLQRARGNYESASSLYNQQLKIDPEHAASLKGLALSHIAQGKSDQVAELLTKAATLTNADLQRDFYLQTQLALAYLAVGKVAQARLAADTAVSAEPRFSWARIAAAEVDLAEGKYFDAERHVIAAMKYAEFPTLHFTLGKIYLAVEDFEGAIEEFGKAFSYKGGVFQTQLGGVLEVKAEKLSELLARERQASLYQAEPITSEVEFKLAENLVRFDDALRNTKPAASGLVSSMILNQAANKASVDNLVKAAEDFVETEGSRKPFRLLYTAGRLVKAGQALEKVLTFTEQALDAAEAATAPDGALRDYPNYDRDGRLRVFRGRALTLRGRALTKLGRTEDASMILEQAVEVYGLLPERNRARWELALTKETAGENKEALDLYIAAYDPPDKASVGADLNRVVIESLYRKVNGSLDGLDERIGRARAAQLAETAQATTPVAPAASVPETATTPAATEPATTNPPARLEAEVKTIAANAEAPAAKNTAVVLPNSRVLPKAVTDKVSSSDEVVLSVDFKETAAPPLKPEAVAKSAPAEETKAGKAEAAEPVPPVTPENARRLVANADPAARPLVLPAVPVVPYLLLPVFEAAPDAMPLLELALTKVDDAVPLVEKSVKVEEVTAEKTPASVETVAPASAAPASAAPAKAALSDSRVAEIERTIEEKRVPGGKRGSALEAAAEAARGHLEGDAPVRVSKPLEPELPAGESGRVVPLPATGERESTPNELPAEVELRAKTIGESAGKFSTDAAKEIRLTVKPAGAESKGEATEPADKPVTEKNKGEETEPKTENKESVIPASTRPRRVATPEKPKAEPGEDKKRSNKQ